MNGITNMVGSLLTYGIGHIHSSTLKEYQIIFLFFGVSHVCPYQSQTLTRHSSLPLHTRLWYSSSFPIHP